MDCYEDDDEISTDYTMPDGSVITVDSQTRIQIGELLLSPDLDERDCDSVQRMAINAIRQSDPDIQMTLGKNIILCGGTAKIEGLYGPLLNKINDLGFNFLNGDAELTTS